MNGNNDTELPDPMLDEAALWHLRSQDERGAEMDWDGFTAWLEADPRHRIAYDEIALASDMLASPVLGEDREVSPPYQDTVDAEPVAPVAGRSRQWRWAGLAIAASLVAVLAVPQMISPAPTVYETVGASQRIALDDGSSVMLAPHSRLSVEGRAHDHMALSGGALFDIRHDPARTLTIKAGDLTISDIGTRFDVQQQEGAVRVAVAEGKVQVSADSMAQPVKLTAGSGVSYDAAAGTAWVLPVKAGDVGAWQDGRLSYDNASLGLVAADLRRYGGVKVDVPVALRSRRFSGTLIVDNGEKALRDLVELMGLRLDGHAGAWRIEQR